MSKDDKTMVKPGINPQFSTDRFEEPERKIIKKWSNEWYLTNSGTHLRLAWSEYDFFLMKPTRVFQEMFSIEREIIVVFSAYSTFEPRSLDAFHVAQRGLSNLRVESVCRVLISEDKEIEYKIKDLLKTDPEQPIVIPFSYNELLSPYDDFFLRNRFRNHFFSRDLFSFQSPLKKDLYFFGRSELLQETVSRHLSGEHTGLFGLRKSGKTSIVYAVERHLESRNMQCLSMDCEDPSVHKLRWNELIEKIVDRYKALKQSDVRIERGDRYSEKKASESFHDDIIKIYNSVKQNSVLIIFDEIERISPKSGSSSHWREGEDFVFFWQTLRAFFQRNPNIYTYMLIGTNPNSVESSHIAGHENPLFNSVKSRYVPSFTYPQIREMVRQLGRYMGLKFEEGIYGKLEEDFGGHPFLIRQFCSQLNSKIVGERPAMVDKARYSEVMDEFKRDSTNYYDMILNVLHDWYHDEYEMLLMLAAGDTDTFEEFAKDSPDYTKHLIGYGLIKKSSGIEFCIESMKEYLTFKHPHERLNLEQEDMLSEISKRRNNIERKLRILLRNALVMKVGIRKIDKTVLSLLGEKRRKGLENIGTYDLLSPGSSPLYFSDLITIIMKEWETIKNIFETENAIFDKDRIAFILKDINTFGRPEAHAKKIKIDEFKQLRLHFKALEEVTEKWVT